ncbi:MAG: hypothetical protein K2X47_12945 [Bdellovibrionales bacterium]|nr:hypothetical protein [Bdellovibrionales bacterium]
MKFGFFVLSFFFVSMAMAKPSFPGVYPYWTYVYVPKAVILELRTDRTLASFMAVLPRGTCDTSPDATCGVILGGKSTIIVFLSDEQSGKEGYVEALETIHMVEETPNDFDRVTAHMMNLMPLDFYTSYGPIYWTSKFPTFKLIEPQQTSVTGKKLIAGGLYLPLLGLFPEFTKNYCPNLPQSWGITRRQMNLCHGVTDPRREYGDFVGFDAQIAPDILELSVHQFVSFFGYTLMKRGNQGVQLRTPSAVFNLKTILDPKLRKGIVGLYYLLPKPAASSYRKAFGKSLEIYSPEKSREVVVSLNPYASLPLKPGVQARNLSCCR